MTTTMENKKDNEKIRDGDIITIDGVRYRIDWEDDANQKDTTYSVSYREDGEDYDSCLDLTLFEGMTIKDARELILEELRVKVRINEIRKSN